VPCRTLVVDGNLAIDDHPPQPWLAAVDAWKRLPDPGAGGDGGDQT